MPKHGEKYVPERNGGLHCWIAHLFASRAPATKMKSNSKTQVKSTLASVKKCAKNSITLTTTADASLTCATAVFTVSGELLGNAFIQGNTGHIVPAVEQPTLLPHPQHCHLEAATSSTPQPLLGTLSHCWWRTSRAATTVCIVGYLDANVDNPEW